jgi:hypothetical protein
MNMIGLIVELLLSWMLLKLVEKKSLEAMGWKTQPAADYPIYVGTANTHSLCHPTAMEPGFSD